MEEQESIETGVEVDGPSVARSFRSGGSTERKKGTKAAKQERKHGTHADAIPKEICGLRCKLVDFKTLMADFFKDQRVEVQEKKGIELLKHLPAVSTDCQ